MAKVLVIAQGERPGPAGIFAGKTRGAGHDVEYWPDDLPEIPSDLSFDILLLSLPETFGGKGQFSGQQILLVRDAADPNLFRIKIFDGDLKAGRTARLALDFVDQRESGKSTAERGFV